MLPDEFSLGLYRVREVPYVPSGAEDRLHVPGNQQIDQAASVDDSRCRILSFPTHRTSPSRDAGKFILSVRSSPDGSTSWLVKVRATVSRAVATSALR